MPARALRHGAHEAEHQGGTDQSKKQKCPPGHYDLGQGNSVCVTGRRTEQKAKMPARALRLAVALIIMPAFISRAKSKNARQGITTGLVSRQDFIEHICESKKQKCPPGHYDSCGALPVQRRDSLEQKAKMPARAFGWWPEVGS